METAIAQSERLVSRLASVRGSPRSTSIAGPKPKIMPIPAL